MQTTYYEKTLQKQTNKKLLYLYIYDFQNLYIYLSSSDLPTYHFYICKTNLQSASNWCYTWSAKVIFVILFFLTDYTYWQVLLKAGLGFLLSYAFQMIKQDKPVCICLYFFLLLSDICTNKIHIDVSTENNGI